MTENLDVVVLESGEDCEIAVTSFPHPEEQIVEQREQSPPKRGGGYLRRRILFLTGSAAILAIVVLTVALFVTRENPSSPVARPFRCARQQTTAPLLPRKKGAWVVSSSEDTLDSVLERSLRLNPTWTISRDVLVGKLEQSTTFVPYIPLDESRFVPLREEY